MGTFEVTETLNFSQLTTSLTLHMLERFNKQTSSQYPLNNNIKNNTIYLFNSQTLHAFNFHEVNCEHLSLQYHLCALTNTSSRFKASMGNHITHRRLDATAKLVHPDGIVHEFNQPITVAELMLEYPQQVVVEFESLGSGKRPTPLPADKKLDMNKVYIMLRMKRGKVAPLSNDEARRVLLNVKDILRSGSVISSIRILPLFARMCSVGNGVGHDVVLRRKDFVIGKVEREDKVELLSEVFDERPEFLSRELSARGWKPNLDTIKEKGADKKVSHWLF